jgi:hypothetical protein
MNQLNSKEYLYGYPDENIFSTEWFKGYYLNGEYYGYWEWYSTNGNVWLKGHYLNNKENGYWEHYIYNEDKLNQKLFYL